MGCFFKFIFLVFIVIFFGLFSILWQVRRLFMRGQSPHQDGRTARPQQHTDAYHKETVEEDATAQPRNRKRVFEDNEGEYVDFEDIPSAK